MLEELNEFYTEKMLEQYRYKKNLIENKVLEQDIIILSCFYSIYDWVKEKDWPTYCKKVNSIIENA